MTAARLIAVVGPSGVGKDSIMAGVAEARPDIVLVRRVITRAADKGGEDYDAVTQDTFAKAEAEGAFCLSWSAHGLSYGIPTDVLRLVQDGTACMANLSRSALTHAAEVFPAVLVLNITASPKTLAQRLSGRGRESADEIAKRLAQAGKPLPEGLNTITIRNDGALQDAVGQAIDALQPVRG